MSDEQEKPQESAPQPQRVEIPDGDQAMVVFTNVRKVDGRALADVLNTATGEVTPDVDLAAFVAERAKRAEAIGAKALRELRTADISPVNKLLQAQKVNRARVKMKRSAERAARAAAPTAATASPFAIKRSQRKRRGK